jgi:hypothetical protein
MGLRSPDDGRTGWPTPEHRAAGSVSIRWRRPIQSSPGGNQDRSRTFGAGGQDVQRAARRTARRRVALMSHQSIPGRAGGGDPVVSVASQATEAPTSPNVFQASIRRSWRPRSLRSPTSLDLVGSAGRVACSKYRSKPALRAVRITSSWIARWPASRTSARGSRPSSIRRDRSSATAIRCQVSSVNPPPRPSSIRLIVVWASPTGFPSADCVSRRRRRAARTAAPVRASCSRFLRAASAAMAGRLIFAMAAAWLPTALRWRLAGPRPATVWRLSAECGPNSTLRVADISKPSRRDPSRRASRDDAMHWLPLAGTASRRRRKGRRRMQGNRTAGPVWPAVSDLRRTRDQLPPAVTSTVPFLKSAPFVSSVIPASASLTRSVV